MRAMQVDDLVSGPGVVGHRRLLSPFWEEVFLVAEAPRSQYDALREACDQDGHPSGHTACVALTGSGLHGQHGRRWVSAPGNLHLSAVLVCDLPAAEFAPVLPALPAVAVANAVGELGAGRLAPGIKWVNDVLLGDRKVAGSLTALRTFRGRITAIIVGIGLNVQQTPSLAADPLALPPTSLQAELLSAVPSLEQALIQVLAELAVQFEGLLTQGPGALLADYRRLSSLIGRRVAIWPDAGPASHPLATGEVVAIGPDLSLRLRGQSTPVTAGRLTLLPAGT